MGFIYQIIVNLRKPSGKSSQMICDTSMNHFGVRLTRILFSIQIIVLVNSWFYQLVCIRLFDQLVVLSDCKKMFGKVDCLLVADQM